MEEILIKAAQLILSLSILVVLHELGHFIPAKLFKTRVEKFYLFFNPWFSLFKVKRGETEYGVGWLPLGGYVKISGMIDESMDKDQMKSEPQSWEYRAKPTWQRLIIILGGVIVNLLLAVFIYSMTLFVWGEKYLPNENLANGVWVVDSLAMDIGLVSGDKILEVDGEPMERFGDLNYALLMGENVTVERNGNTQSIQVPEDLIGNAVDKKGLLLVYPRIPFYIGDIPDSSHNIDIGLEVKDRVLSIGGQEAGFFDQAKDVLEGFSGQVVELEVMRDDQRMSLDAQVSVDGKIGVAPVLDLSDLEKMGAFEFESNRYGFLAAFPAGLKKGYKELGRYWQQLSKIADISSGAYKGLGSFGTIGSLFPSTWDWQSFWELTALLSIILALMNVLPIPALDGGHAMFIIIEMVSGRPPSQKVLEAAQTVGMVLLLLIMTYAIGNDIFRLLLS